jgi:hypothetical protein
VSRRLLEQTIDNTKGRAFWSAIFHKGAFCLARQSIVETGDSTTVSMTTFAVIKDTYDYYSVMRFTVIVDKSFGTM